MKKQVMNRTKTTVTANKWLVGTAYATATTLATAHQGTIGKTAENRFTAEFPTAKSAQAFVTEWEKGYQANTKTAEPPKPATAGKGARKGKGNGKAVDFSKVKGTTKSDRNKAAHALIVGMGIESGSAEYNALWKKWQSVR